MLNLIIIIFNKIILNANGRYPVTFHQVKNSIFNDANIAKAILSNCLNAFIN